MYVYVLSLFRFSDSLEVTSGTILKGLTGEKLLAGIPLLGKQQQRNSLVTSAILEGCRLLTFGGSLVLGFPNN